MKTGALPLRLAVTSKNELRQPMIQIAIFASGRGTNAENITQYFSEHVKGRVTLILTNNPNAGVKQVAKDWKVPCEVFTRTELTDGTVLNKLKAAGIDFVVLAGFLWLIPQEIISTYRDRIVNIHPALLPKFGGKGMYGDRVHQAVSDSGEGVSGITIHKVDEHYDAGDIIAQFKCEIEPESDPDLIASRVHNLEMKHYPEVIESLISKL
jgi:phosphoribosylglycinamide formyltransferase-1